MIDQEKIKTKIQIIRENVAELEKMKNIPFDQASYTIRDLAAAKYFIRTSLEAMIDIGAHIIAKNGLGSPSTNVEIIYVLSGKGIIAEAHLATYTKMVKYRNRLTHFYSDVTPAEIADIIQSRLGDFHDFIKEILSFIQK